MALYDPISGTFNDASYALDVSEAEAGNRSIFESASNVITKGVPLTGLAVINSFANTAIDVGNWLGVTNAERLSVEGEVGDEYNQYYQQHKQGIEAAGLLVGSLIPGLAAIKTLKLAQGGILGEAMKSATGLFSGPQAKIVRGALAEIQAGDAALYGAVQADKYKAIALGFGEQALQGMVYEIATVATMKASPLLDQDGYREVTENIFYGALVGGGIGGLIEGIGTRAIINKALLQADKDTKLQEVAKYMGRGDYTAGDRVVSLLDSIYEIPTPTNNLGKKKLAATSDSAMLNSRKILTSIVGDGDEDLSNSVFTTLMDMKNKNAMSKEDMYGYLARLSKISRIDAPASTPSGSIVYFNSSVKTLDSPLSEMMAEGVEGTSGLGYRTRPFATEVKVGRFYDDIDWEGTKVKRYVTPQDAFDAGNDIFIDSNRKVHINPDAPNLERVARPGESRPLTAKEEEVYRSTGHLPEGSKPLYGAPIILNTKTGAVSESAIPVIGDFGKPELTDKGLKFGDRFSVQSLESPITTETSSLDANARYVWAATRGLKNGDVIKASDTAMLEQVYREAVQIRFNNDSGYGLKDFLERRKISFEGAPTPINLPEVQQLIRDSKDQLIHDILQSPEGHNVSVTDLSRRANVPEDYIQNNFRATNMAEYMLPIEDSANVMHAKLEYNVGNIYQQDGQILRGLTDVQYRIQVVKDALDTAVAKHFGEGWEDFKLSGTSTDATIEGVGAKAFRSSNADYGNTLAQSAERVGRRVTDWYTKRMGEVSTILAPAVNALRNDPEATAEWGMFVSVRRRTNQQYMFLPKDIAEQYKLPENTAVLRNSLVKDRNGSIVGWNDYYIPEGFTSGLKEGAAQRDIDAVGLRTFYSLSPKVAAFERANSSVNDYRVISRNNWYSAQGLGRSIEPGALYAPAIDTAKYPHFALVKQRPGMGMADDGVAIITAETASDLEQKIASLRDDFSVYTKDMLKTHHEVLGDYEYNRLFAESNINNMLSRRGVLNNIFPDTRAETIIKDYTDWHSKQEMRLVRDYVELGNGQLFAEMDAMGKRFTATETSKTGFVEAMLGRSVPNPYNSYKKTALAISDKEEYRLWNEANEKAEAFFSTAFRVAKSAFTAANKGIIPFEEASAMAQKFGLGNVYGNATDAGKAYLDIANKLPPERYLSKFVATANSVLSATAIRLDVFQSIINAVSTPVLLLSETNSARNSQLAKLVTTELPDGSGRMIPATSKLFYNSVANWFSKDVRQQWMPLYKELGVVRDRSSDYFTMVDQLTLPYGKFSESEVVKKLKSATDLGGKLTGSELSEEFARFIAADTGRQLFEAAGYAGRELTDNISTFVNRVHGNYVASQRPVAFQGPIGQAIGLFQTYQFNLLHQLLRYVENGEGKSLMILSGMQSTLFGLQGLPGFQAINSHIVGNAAGNPSHKDIYGTTTNLVDKKLGDYLLYGTMSNWLNTGLYSRGDINPRQITILPTNPLDYPAISGGIKLVGNLMDTAKKISDGGSPVSSILLGLEHNGLSRPLTGIAQIAQGYSTTSQGSLVAATRQNPMGDNVSGLSELVSAANFSRLLGARPLDEAVTMDAMFRKTLYQAKDSTRVADLGQAVKTHLYAGQQLEAGTVEKFANQYASSGGRIENFSRKMLEWTQSANSSTANQVYKSLRSPLNQQMQIIMGGQKLPDFSNVGSFSPAETTTAPTE